ncbi:MAG: DUF5060 domain-containing protein, partial [Verrucomicrobiae bacterium]|nr:DUF5060 domain-containing protein [Verrucomicrobiae bacterium]
YETVRMRIAGPEIKGNPYDPDLFDIQIEVKSPNGRTVKYPAFFGQPYERVRRGEPGRESDWWYPIGEGCWQARFAPLEPGVHEVRAIWYRPGGLVASSPVRFESKPSGNRGFVRVSRRDPRYLEFSNGDPFFGIGQNLAFIGSQQYITLSKAEEVFEKLASNGANYVRVWTGCEDWAIGIEARKSAWGRSWDWRPPFSQCPDDPSRKCVYLSGDGAVVRVDPSHRVALRPETRYVLSGRVMVGGEATVVLVEPHAGGGLKLETAQQGQWSHFRHEFVTSKQEYWLVAPIFQLKGSGRAWLDGLSLKETGSGPELLWEADPNRPVRRIYNQLDCFFVDELVEAAVRSGVYLQLCLFTRDLYMKDLKDPESADYKHAVEDAKKLIRYAIARWGSATSVAAWEYWNEMDPGLPTEKFYSEVGSFLEEIDLYRHLRTTSTWGPSAKDCRHPKLDLADVHFYLRPSDRDRLRNEVEAVIERTAWLRQQAPGKPVHLGEFGIANERWQPTPEMQTSPMVIDFHNALWASALSGAATTALFWWWDRLDRLNHYRHYAALSRFVNDIPWTRGDLVGAEVKSTPPGLQVVGLQNRDCAWLWVFDPAASWENVVVKRKQPEPVSNAVLGVSGFRHGLYDVCWFDTREGRWFLKENARPNNGILELRVPAFTGDVAVKVTPALE